MKTCLRRKKLESPVMFHFLFDCVSRTGGSRSSSRTANFIFLWCLRVSFCCSILMPFLAAVYPTGLDDPPHNSQSRFRIRTWATKAAGLLGSQPPPDHDNIPNVLTASHPSTLPPPLAYTCTSIAGVVRALRMRIRRER